MPGGFDGDGEVLLELRLAGEIGKALWPERGLELALAFERGSGDDAFVAHVLSHQLQRTAKQRLEFIGEAGGLGFAYCAFGGGAIAAQVDQS